MRLKPLSTNTMLIPYWFVKALCVVCFVLNTISICLCVSALFLLIVAYLDLGHIFADISHSTKIQPSEGRIFNVSILNFALNDSESSNATEKHAPPLHLPNSNPNQLPLIIYLLFYLATAVLGVLGAITHYQPKKIYLLVSHALLLFAIITFNLVAWFEFRALSPLNSSPYEEIHLLLAALFDFIDLLVALCLITALTMNKVYIGHKQRNSISPIADNASVHD